MDRFVRALGNKESVTYLFLVAACGALTIRSVSQLKDIDVMQAEKDDLEKGNTAMKKTMWNWKQQLFSEATDSSPVPLSRLKAIHGEVPATTQQGITVTPDTTSPAPKFVVCKN